MKVTDEMVYAAQRARTARLARGRGGGPDDGMREAVQAVLDLLAPPPAPCADGDACGVLENARRVSGPLTEVRTVLSRADTAAAHLAAWERVDEPEQEKIQQALSTVRELLLPWARKGWKPASGDRWFRR